jgi:hypothetical protein
MTEVADVLLKRESADRNGTTPLFYNDEIDALLREIKRLSDPEKDTASAVYRLALGALCLKSKRKEPNTIRIFPKDLEGIEATFGTIMWRKLPDGGLELLYVEKPLQEELN